MKYEKTAKRLMKALSDNNMRAQELSNKTGIGKSSISHYINGFHAPSNISAGKMADVLGVSPLWLMGFDVEEQPAAVPSSDGRAESNGFSTDNPLHRDEDNGINSDKPLHVDESKSFYDTDRLLAEVRKYGTDTEKQRAALSAALDDLPIPERKRKLIQRILQMDPKQVELFLGMAEEMRSQ